jgi:hypothetical protein
LKTSGSSSTRLAGDGTVIEAACSHYNLLKEEAVKARAEAELKAVERAPDDQTAQLEQQRSKQCQDIFGQRQAARHSHGKSSETLRISANEPDAMVQRLKRGRGFAASYKPSVLANEDRIIMAHALDASSETLMMAPMLDQSAEAVALPPLLEANLKEEVRRAFDRCAKSAVEARTLKPLAIRPCAQSSKNTRRFHWEGPCPRRSRDLRELPPDFVSIPVDN